MASSSSKKIIWQALDHIKEKRTDDWFWIVGVIAIGMTVLAIYFGNYLFGLFILLATFTSFLMAHSAPKMVEYEINRKGLRTGDVLYTYSSLESFWIIDEDGFDRDRILFKSNKMFMPLIIVPLGDAVSIEEVRDYLLENLKEEEMHEPISQHIMNALGF